MKKLFAFSFLLISTVNVSLTGCGNAVDGNTPGSVSISVSETVQLGALLTMRFTDPNGFNSHSPCDFEISSVDGSGDSSDLALPSYSDPVRSSICVASRRLSG